MKITSAIRYLEYHNAWRRGAEIMMPNPKLMGIAIARRIWEVREIRGECE